MPHFTYVEPDLTSLKQGDILDKNDGVKSILAEVHPHYTRDDYRHFIVLTQTCDLARRDSRHCKSPYITIAAVRSLDFLLTREIGKLQKTDAERIGGICNSDLKQRMAQFLERLFNNNEPDYFFLSDDTSIGFPERMVAFLKLSISIKADLHYDTCLSAKVLELTDAFKAKLGWLVGNMYSRVGTVEWVPTARSKEDFRSLIDSILTEHVVWRDKKLITKLQSGCKERVGLITKEEILKLASTMSIKSDREELLDRIGKIIKESGLVRPEANVSKIVSHINNDPFIAQKFQ